MTDASEILLLENDLLIANEVEETLRQAGFTKIHIGGNCSYALDWLTNNKPLLAIVDPQMADGRCREVFDVLRMRKVPFVVYSHDYVSTLERHDARGGQWVLKPAANEVLLRVMDITISSATAQ